MLSTPHHALLQSIIDHLPSGVTMFDADQRLVAYNQQVRTLLDFPDELFAHGMPTLYDFALFNARRGEYGPGDPEQQARAVSDRARSLQPHVFERQRPDGTVIEIRGTPLPTGGFVSIYTDVTARKRTEQEARRLAVYLDAVINALPQGVTVIDEHLVIRLWNRSFEQLLDLPQGLMKPGVTFEDVARSNAQRGEYGEADVETKVAEAAALARQFLPHRLIRQRPNGRTLEIVGSALSIDGQIRGFVTTYTDVTELREAQQALERLNAELDQRVTERTRALQDLNKELESFTYSVSHDLRTPLRSIQGFSTLLLETEAEKLSEQGRTSLQRIQSNAGRMGSLITDLLSMAQHSRGELDLQRVDLSAMAQGVANELQRADVTRQADWRIVPGLWVQADPGLVRLVLQNLLGNAWKYTAQRGVAVIELCGGGETGGMCWFELRDNGAGFDMQYANQLFQPFQRLHRPHEFDGTGIGLAIVQRILQRHGGSISGQAEIGQGALFRFCLPCVQAQAPQGL
ncbi:sensor histidine kinase [Hydrogenophaga flava]|uniref:sensor histidine kinase n=1 Tax=Hydrogenophaga flava TaxID=65657 RepID=UPI0008248166|nr:PAS-domain containing protein [Hydrogenophaga flava]